MTITEALAEIKMIRKKVDSKMRFIASHAARQEKVRDPLAKDGGSDKVIRSEIQAINDILVRMRNIRIAVQKANLSNRLTVCGREMSVADWLAFRKEVLPITRDVLGNLNNAVLHARNEAKKLGVQAGSQGAKLEPNDIVVHIDEVQIQNEIEVTDEIENTLDGALSKFNATTEIELED